MPTAEQLFHKVAAKPFIFEAALCIENTCGAQSQSFAYGGKDIDTPMIIASITKMFTTAAILQLCERKDLSLDDKVDQFFDPDVLEGLHVYGGYDYSCELTIAHLLFMTSGLPDYFTDESSGLSKADILAHDRMVSLDDILAATKKLSAHFPPGSSAGTGGNAGKAFYSDVNFDLLGEVLKTVSGQNIDQLFADCIFKPLGMKNSYVPTTDSFVPHTHSSVDKVTRRLYNISCPASAGCISTPRDLMAFSRAFWDGELFNSRWHERIAQYSKIQFGPFYYGGGYMQIRPGELSASFDEDDEIVGHSGSTGSFMYYYPQAGLHIVGDLCQTEAPIIATELLMSLAEINRGE